MRVLIIVPQQSRVSGNWVTARRFESGLTRLDCTVEIIEVAPDDSRLVIKTADRFKPDVVLLLHAYRSGLPWLKSQVSLPSVVMLTGTDQNQGLRDDEQQGVITDVLQDTDFIIIQNPLLATEFTNRHKNFASKVRQPSPGISLGATDYDLFKLHRLSREHPLFLYPAGLRPVKGVLELLMTTKQLFVTRSPLQLAVCGPILDASYGEQCLAEINSRSWMHYLGAIPAEAMASVMRQGDVVINNSFAEGLSNTLLEAVSLGCPVLARNNPGNAAIVEHGVNGYLYDNFAEYTSYIHNLLNEDIRQRLRQPPADRFSAEQEAHQILKILEQATVDKR